MAAERTYPPFSAGEPEQVEQEILRILRQDLPHLLDVTDPGSGRIVQVFLRGEYPATDLCMVVEVDHGRLGYAWPIWPIDEDEPYMSIADCAEDSVEYALMNLAETVNAVADTSLSPHDEDGVHWVP